MENKINEKENLKEKSLRIGSKYVLEQLLEELIAKYSDLSNYTLDELVKDSYLDLNVEFTEYYIFDYDSDFPMINTEDYRYEVSKYRLKEAEKNGAIAIEGRILFSPVELKKLVDSLGLEINISELAVSEDQKQIRDTIEKQIMRKEFQFYDVTDKNDVYRLVSRTIEEELPAFKGTVVGQEKYFTHKYNILFRYLTKENTNSELYEQINNEIKKINVEKRKRKNDMKYRNGSKAVFQDLCEKLSDRDYLKKNIEFTEYTESYDIMYDDCRFSELSKFDKIDENEFRRYELDSSKLESINKQDLVFDKDDRVYFSVHELKKIADFAMVDLNISDLNIDTKTKDVIGMKENGRRGVVGRNICKIYSYDIYLSRLVKENKGKRNK